MLASVIAALVFLSSSRAVKKHRLEETPIRQRRMVRKDSLPSNRPPQQSLPLPLATATMLSPRLTSPPPQPTLGPSLGVTQVTTNLAPSRTPNLAPSKIVKASSLLASTVKGAPPIVSPVQSKLVITTPPPSSPIVTAALRVPSPVSSKLVTIQQPPITVSKKTYYIPPKSSSPLGSPLGSPRTSFVPPVSSLPLATTRTTYHPPKSSSPVGTTRTTYHPPKISSPLGSPLGSPRTSLIPPISALGSTTATYVLPKSSSPLGSPLGSPRTSLIPSMNALAALPKPSPAVGVSFALPGSSVSSGSGEGGSLKMPVVWRGSAGRSRSV